MVSPKSRKFRGEWVRKIDKPYGKEKFKGDYLKFINVDYFSYESSYVLSLEEIPEKFRFSVKEAVKDREKWCNREFYMEESSKVGKTDEPYPYFETKYCPAWEIEPELIAADWRAAMVEHYQHWFERVEDEKVKNFFKITIKRLTFRKSEL